MTSLFDVVAERPIDEKPSDTPKGARTYSCQGCGQEREGRRGLLEGERRMSLQTLRGPNGTITVSLVDAVFRDQDGKPVTMEFHPYCGPAFFDADGENFIPDEDDPLWDQFNGWYKAKGPKLPAVVRSEGLEMLEMVLKPCAEGE